MNRYPLTALLTAIVVPYILTKKAIDLSNIKFTENIHDLLKGAKKAAGAVAVMYNINDFKRATFKYLR